MKKILIFKSDRIGDLINISSIIKNLKHNFNNSEITLVCSKYNSEIAKYYPELSKILIFENSIIKFILKYFKDSQIHFTDYKGHAKELANQCVEDGFKNLAVVGGDGTINEVLSEIIDKDINLAVIPKGTGNGFARMMKIPLTPKKAIKSLKKWKPISCDIGKLNEDYFINIAGLGFDAFIAEKFNNLPSNLRKLGKIGYFQLALTEYLEYHHAAKGD